MLGDVWVFIANVKICRARTRRLHMAVRLRDIDLSRQAGRLVD